MPPTIKPPIAGMIGNHRLKRWWIVSIKTSQAYSVRVMTQAKRADPIPRAMKNASSVPRSAESNRHHVATGRGQGDGDERAGAKLEDEQFHRHEDAGKRSLEHSRQS